MKASQYFGLTGTLWFIAANLQTGRLGTISDFVALLNFVFCLLSLRKES